jgi:hypothetical protein
MRSLNLATFFLIVVVASLGQRAKADIMTVFDATGTFTDGSNLSGTVTVDTDSGVVTDLDLILGFISDPPSPITFGLSFQALQAGGFYEVDGSSSSGDQISLIINLGSASSLVDYAGGPLANGTDSISTSYQLSTGPSSDSPILLFDGALASAASAPEPSSLIAWSGLIAVAVGVHRYRWRCAQSTAN